MDQFTLPEHDHSALVVIDMQRDVLDGGPMEVPGTSAVVQRIARLLDHFRRAGRPIVHVVRLYRSDGSNVDLCRRSAVASGLRVLIAGSDGCQIAAPLLPHREVVLDVDSLLGGSFQLLGAQEWALYKPRWGAFHMTPLEGHLRSLGVSTIVFAGCNFPNCPRASVYEASERDFRIVALADAISGLYSRGVRELENIGCSVLGTDEYLREADRRAPK